MDIQSEIRKQAKKLLEEKKVDIVIGFENTDKPMYTTPCFITEAKDADRLVWNMFCGNNLSKYLIGRKDKVGIVAKGCDMRSVIVLINENQIKRENLFIIGVPCIKMIDPKKVERYVGEREILDARADGDKLAVKGDDFEEKLDINDCFADCCGVCLHRNPPVYDVMIGEKVEETDPALAYLKIEELEATSPKDRWEYFNKELSKCIRCYACREACPLCYCKKCFCEKSFPNWFAKSTDESDITAFHLLRALHTTGRCVDCGACVKACPQGIDLRMLTKKIEKDIKELYGSEAGMSIDEKMPLSTYKESDPQEFIK